MSVLVLMMCLNSMASCDEGNAKAVWRAEMPNLTCEEKIPTLVSYIKDNRLNPVNGYYSLACRSVMPGA